MPKQKPVAYLIIKPPTVNLSAAERETMEHALGLTPTGCGKRPRWAYRNRFCACLESPDGLLWERMVERGVARRWNTQPAPKSYMYSVTVLGIDSLPPDIQRRIPRALKR